MTIGVKRWLILLAAALMGCSTQNDTTAGAEIQFEKPNIVFILVDDLGWGDVGFHESEIATPNIDTLASRGIILEHSYAFPICSPTRAALLTGRNPIQFGVDGPMENDAMLPVQLTLLPEYLRQAGYETWMVGKWHLGMAETAAAPPARGFDYFYGHLGGFIDYYTHVYFGGLDWQKNGQSVREAGYSTDLLSAEAVRLVSEHNSNKPFFLYLSYNAPHTPLQYPPSSEVDYSAIADPDRRVFAQMTTYLDTQIGTLLKALGARNMLEKTLIVFMSDNGGNLEAGASNGNLRAGKGSAYEGGVRVPAVVSWPQGLVGGQVSQHPVFVQDWLPTLLEMTGTPYSTDTFDGVSAWDAIARNEDKQRETPVVIGSKHSKAVYDWPWKLVRNQAANGEEVRDQLFNVIADPTETTDVSEQHIALMMKLAGLLDSLPVTDSKAARGPNPETLFRDASGAFDYAIRKPETREPWAEEAKTH